MNPFKDRLKANATPEQCTEFLKALADSGRHYHIDDSPEEIINYANNMRIFTDAEAKVLRHNIGVCFDVSEINPGFNYWDVYYPFVKAYEARTENVPE